MTCKTRFAFPALLLMLPLPAWSQADGPRSSTLIPTDVNILVPTYLRLTGNYSFDGQFLVPGAEVTSDVIVLTFMRSFAIGNRYAQVWINPVFGRIDASGTLTHPGTGQTFDVNVDTSGLGDAIFNFKIGLVGAQPIGLKDFAQQNREFQMGAFFGVTAPTGEYDSDKPLNLGTNTWAFRLGLPMVVPFGPPQSPTYLEIFPSATLYTDNNDPTLGADRREQDPLFDIQTHLTHNFTPQFWAGLDLRYRTGSETTTDGVSDDNKQDVLGGGISAGYAFTPRMSVQASLGTVLTESDGSDEEMIRIKFAYSFF
jgi:hypothetical protein